MIVKDFAKDLKSNFGNLLKRRINVMVLWGILMLLNYGCSRTVYPSSYQSRVIIVDGDLKDWNLPLQYYDEDSRLNYSISNDEGNLYICIRAVDPISQIKMIRAGLNVWIDTAGKKSQRVGIRFPLDEKLLANHIPEPHEKGKKINLEAMMNKMVLEQSQMQLIGFKNTNNGVSVLHNQSGITTAIKWDISGVLSYEAVIPFKTFYRDRITAGSLAKVWTITFVLNGIESPTDGKKEGGDDAGGGNRGGGMSGGGMNGGMRASGMRGGGGMHGRAVQRDELSEPKIVRNYVRMTVKQ